MPQVTAAQDSVSTLMLSCKDYDLSQDCSFSRGPKRMIQVNDQRMRIAGSSDGRIVLMMHEYAAAYLHIDYARRNNHSTAVNNNYETLKGIIIQNAMQVLSLKRVGKSNIIDGYIIHASGDLYSVLTPFTVDRQDD